MQVNVIDYQNQWAPVKFKERSVEQSPVSVDGVSIDFDKIKKSDLTPQIVSSSSHKKKFVNKNMPARASAVPVCISLDIDGKEIKKNIMATVTDKDIKLNMLHTNDIHGKMPCIATLIQPDEFWIDAGDSWEGFNSHSTISLGREETDLMNKRDCDLAVPGNHFCDNKGKEVGERLLRKAHFPYLGANVKGLSPYAIAEVEGVKIAFIGVQTTTKKFPMVDPTYVDKIQLSDPLEAVQKSMAEVKAKGVDNIIIISHLGLKPDGVHKHDTKLSDMALAEKVDGIDLIIGGHTHTPTYEPVVVNGTTIVHAGKEGREDSKDGNRLFLGDLTISINRETGRITSIEDKLIEVDQSGPLDKDVKNIHKRHYMKTEKALKEKEGVITAPLFHELMAPEDTTLGNLLTDAIREETKADIAILNSSFFPPLHPFRNDPQPSIIPVGDVTLGDICDSSFWMGKVDTGIETWNVSGDTVRKALEDGVTKLLNGGKNCEALSVINGVNEALYQVSGLTMSYDPDRPEGQRVTEVLVGGEPLKPDKSYRLTTSYVQGNWDPILKDRDEESVINGRNIRHIMADYLTGKSPYTPVKDGRIKRGNFKGVIKSSGFIKTLW